jgi:putative Ca2+/H+ antiporter (TMEM165/GDT1 family)
LPVAQCSIIVGKMLGKRLPEQTLKYSTAFIFIAYGVWALIEACRLR